MFSGSCRDTGEADLDEKGVRLAEITARALKEIPFAICFTSPLIRAKHTAEILLEGREIPIVEEPRIMEIGFGEWEGPLLRSRTHGNAGRKIPEVLRRSPGFWGASGRGRASWMSAGGPRSFIRN